jgi:hypothetical protein
MLAGKKNNEQWGSKCADVLLRTEDLSLLERAFAQVLLEHDTRPDELAMLLMRLV